jgi:CRP/FNR family transcriptional regulator, cyclic AMP receptor protein
MRLVGQPPVREDHRHDEVVAPVSAAAGVVVELAAVRLFAGLDDAALSDLAAATFVRRLAKDQILFSAGEPSEHLFVVRSGRLRVVSSSAHGEELVLTTVGPGEAIGELSVLDRLPRSAGVDALQASELLVLPAAAVRELLERNSDALLAIALELAAGMRRLTGSMADLIFLDLPRRLAKLLLADSVPRPDGTASTVLESSQSGVAARLGVTRQSLNRALAGLVRRGWIDVAGTTVELRDVPALHRFVES